jgi:hypothetical protein
MWLDRLGRLSLIANAKTDTAPTPMAFTGSASKIGALLLLALALSPVLVVAAKTPDKRRAVPKPEQLVGTWIGFWEDEEFTRLELHADSTGYCAFVAPPESSTHDYGVQVYRVTQWTLKEYSLVISLSPTEPRLENVYLKGWASFDRLDLEVGGANKKWKEKLVLRKESRMQTSNAETKSKIEDADRK